LEPTEDTVFEFCIDVDLGTWVLNDAEHLLGDSAAAVPAAHIMMKVEPVSSLLRKKSSELFGTYAISKIVVNRPNSETNKANFIRNGGLVSVFMEELPRTSS
jgi:hypothetical protein